MVQWYNIKDPINNSHKHQQIQTYQLASEATDTQNILVVY